VFNSTTNLVKNIYKITEEGGNLHLFLMLLGVAFSHPFGLIVGSTVLVAVVTVVEG
jgi:hypothetical protein